MIRRLIPFPLLTLALLAMWILLTGFSPGHMLFGAAIAVMVSRTMLSLRPERPTLRLGRAAVKLALIVFIDIIRSNIAVAKIILLRPPERNSGFIELSTALRNPDALAMLAIIITATPGSLWVQHDAHRHIILVHVLDLIDEQQWARLIQERYETLLIEIFE
jgi:multicomponent K+:H+ antiporter subunit E